MSYRVDILPKAAGELKAIPPQFSRQIVVRIKSLAGDPRPPGCKALKGGPKGSYRIRSGDYRVLYEVDDGRSVVTVVRVADRKDVYR